jgi:gliding motility-associated-like protein
MAGLLRNSYKKAVWLLCHTAFLAGLMPAFAQHNLVPNGGFELLDTCPSDQAHIHFAFPWQGPGSADLYNSCCTVKQPQYKNFGTPDNWLGWQIPKSGNGYAGMVLFEIAEPEMGIRCEYLQVKMSEKLLPGKSYCYQYFVSPTNYQMVFKEFSILVTENPPTFNTWNPTYNNNYINAVPTSTCYTGFTTDTAAWYEVKGDFVALGDEQYLTIGFFRKISSSDTLILSSGYRKTAYYYIDDVSVWPCDAPVYEADAGNNKHICFGDAAILGQNLPDDEYRFLWSAQSHKLTPKDHWDTLATTAILSVKPTQTTTYYLWVRDFKMDVTYDSVTVYVDPCMTLPVIPNVFTPNGDGINDVFAFKNHEGWELETCIHNRWGKVVFEGKNDHWWDGTIKGQQASPGVYYYTVTARSHFGQHETLHGVVTVMR